MYHKLGMDHDIGQKQFWWSVRCAMRSIEMRWGYRYYETSLCKTFQSWPTHMLIHVKRDRTKVQIDWRAQLRNGRNVWSSPLIRSYKTCGHHYIGRIDRTRKSRLRNKDGCDHSVNVAKTQEADVLREKAYNRFGSVKLSRRKRKWLLIVNVKKIWDWNWDSNTR